MEYNIDPTPLKGYKKIGKDRYSTFPSLLSTLEDAEINDKFKEFKSLLSGGVVDRNKLLNSLTDNKIGVITTKFNELYGGKHKPTTKDFRPTSLVPDSELATAPELPVSTTSTSVATNDNLVNSSADATKNQDVGVLSSNLMSGFRAISAGLLARDGVPKWEEPENYKKNLQKLNELSNMGLSAETKSLAEYTRDRQYARGLSAIKAIGGGSSGAMIGALSSLNESAFNSGLNTILADGQARRYNMSNYTSALNNYVNIDRMKFTDEFGIASAKQNAAASVIQANMKDIQDRNDFEATYGRNSTWQRLMDAKLKRENLLNKATMLAINNYR